ncbi:MAG TPA: LysM domain-containing protein [Candidatus Limnocylindrales bacterium]|nr:LysM domain-containing protein [Candidatus Limnocylindrales bacterium]
MAEADGTTAGAPDPAPDRAATPFRPAIETPLADSRHVCPFLATEGPDGALRAAIGWPGPANRCTAVGDPQPQSDRQQELVCLTASHVNCPRYLRGEALAAAPPPKPVREPISAAVVGSALVLAAALAASLGFLVVRGGFDLPIASPGASQLAAISTASPAPSRTPGPSPSLPAGPSPSLRSSPVPTPAPTPAPTPGPTPAPTLRQTPAPSSNRYLLLTPCPSTPSCWIYTVRRGDNLQSIANYFGVALDRIRAMNPGLSTPIRPGDRLRLPPPTR